MCDDQRQKTTSREERDATILQVDVTDGCRFQYKTSQKKEDCRSEYKTSQKKKTANLSTRQVEERRLQDKEDCMIKKTFEMNFKIVEDFNGEETCMCIGIGQ